MCVSFVNVCVYNSVQLNPYIGTGHLAAVAIDTNVYVQTLNRQHLCNLPCLACLCGEMWWGSVR